MWWRAVDRSDVRSNWWLGAGQEQDKIRGGMGKVAVVLGDMPQGSPGTDRGYQTHSMQREDLASRRRWLTEQPCPVSLLLVGLRWPNRLVLVGVPAEEDRRDRAAVAVVVVVIVVVMVVVVVLPSYSTYAGSCSTANRHAGGCPSDRTSDTTDRSTALRQCKATPWCVWRPWHGVCGVITQCWTLGRPNKPKKHQKKPKNYDFCKRRHGFCSHWRRIADEYKIKERGGELRLLRARVFGRG
jgi:hypothetical protein